MLNVLSGVIGIYRNDVSVADTTILDPQEVTCLISGEWLASDASGKYVRVTAATEKIPRQVWADKGDYVVQALGKITTLWSMDYVGETDVYDNAGSYVTGATELTVDDFTLGGTLRAGLKVAVSTNVVHAVCVKAPQDNGGKLQFQRVSPYVKA